MVLHQEEAGGGKGERQKFDCGLLFGILKRQDRWGKLLQLSLFSFLDDNANGKRVERAREGKTLVPDAQRMNLVNFERGKFHYVLAMYAKLSQDL